MHIVLCVGVAWFGLVALVGLFGAAGLVCPVGVVSLVGAMGPVGWLVGRVCLLVCLVGLCWPWPALFGVVRFCQSGLRGVFGCLFGWLVVWLVGWLVVLVCVSWPGWPGSPGWFGGFGWYWWEFVGHHLPWSALVGHRWH